MSQSKSTVMIQRTNKLMSNADEWSDEEETNRKRDRHMRNGTLLLTVLAVAVLLLLGFYQKVHIERHYTRRRQRDKVKKSSGRAATPLSKEDRLKPEN